MTEFSLFGRQKVFMVTTVEDDPMCLGLFASRAMAERFVALVKADGIHDNFQIDDHEIYTTAEEAL